MHSLVGDLHKNTIITLGRFNFYRRRDMSTISSIRRNTMCAASLSPPHPPPNAYTRPPYTRRDRRQRDYSQKLVALCRSDQSTPPSALDACTKQEDAGYDAKRKPSDRYGWCFLCFDSGGLQHTVVVQIPWPNKVNETAARTTDVRATRWPTAVEGTDVDVQVMRALQNAVYQQYGSWKRWLWCCDICIAEEVNVSFVSSSYLSDGCGGRPMVATDTKEIKPVPL